MTNPANFDNHLSDAICKALGEHVNSPYRLFTYDSFLEQGIGCNLRMLSDDHKILYVINKKILTYQYGITTEIALNNPMLYQEPVTINLRNSDRFEPANLKITEMFNAMLLQHEMLEIRYQKIIKGL